MLYQEGPDETGKVSTASLTKSDTNLATMVINAEEWEKEVINIPWNISRKETRGCNKNII